MEANHSHLTTQKSFYVEISRAGYRAKLVADDRPCFVHGQILPTTAYINPDTMLKLFGEGPVEETAQLRCGRSVALVVWPGKRPSGELIVNDSYLPETVGNLADLKERAALYGCKNELNSGLNRLKRCLTGYGKTGPFPLAIVLLARGPRTTSTGRGAGAGLAAEHHAHQGLVAERAASLNCCIQDHPADGHNRAAEQKVSPTLRVDSPGTKPVRVARSISGARRA